MIFLASVLVLGLLLLTADFILRLHQLPPLSDRDAAVLEPDRAGVNGPAQDPLAQSVVAPDIAPERSPANSPASDTRIAHLSAAVHLPASDRTVRAVRADGFESLDQWLVKSRFRADEVVAPDAGLRHAEADFGGGRPAGAPRAAAPQTERLAGAGRGPIADLSLTFYGLPARGDLSALLAVLEQHGVEATFFVDGPAMLARSDVVQRLAAEGHIIGMVYSEPVPRLTSLIFGPRLIDNATQLMIVRETGKRTLLVSGPDSAPPESPERLATLATQTAAGYLPVLTGAPAPYGEPEPLAVMARLQNPGAAAGSFVLRFDLGAGGGSHIVAALPSMLPELVDEGFGFRPLRTALGLAPEQAMPVSAIVSPMRDAVAFGFLRFVQSGLTIVLVSLMAIAALRSLAFLGLAFWRGKRTTFDPGFHPPVTVIVPAFNEEVVIERCVRSLLDQDYPGIQVIVVDDGSVDRTSQVVLDNFGDDPRVRLIWQENRGKWYAANHALSAVTTPIFVVADADSLFPRDTISWLVQQFKDESVGAVAGLVEVGNHENLLSDCQRVEYIVSQNVMRRAYEVFEGILVVPGAIGAWSTEAVVRAREFSGDTVTEDADLTIAVQRAGYRVRFQEQAVSVTEAPETVTGFLRQRLRWIFGMLQVAWKHLGAIGEARPVGYISIVDMVLFGPVTSVLSPMVDVLLVLLLVQGIVSLSIGAEMSMAGFPTVLLVSYLALILIDIMNALAAFWFERRFSLKLLLLVPFLRFGYRQLLYLSTLRAMWRALIGRAQGWNKLERTGSVFALRYGDTGRLAGVRGAVRRLARAAKAALAGALGIARAGRLRRWSMKEQKE